MIEYEVNAKFAKDVTDMMADASLVEFNPIREQEVEILTLIKTQTDSKGEHVEPKGNPVVCKKIPPAYQLLTKGKYLIVGDYYFWTHATDLQKNAAIHRALSTVGVERSKKGLIVLKTRKPDVQEFRATIARFGAWNEPLLDAREAFKTAAKSFAESQKPKA